MVFDSKQPLFKGISEIVLVVADLEASMKKQWEMFGIGPWEIWTFDKNTVREMVTYNVVTDFSIRVAYTKIGDTHWELIQPLDNKSTYYDVLQEKGEGVHNIVFEVDDFDETLAHMKALDIGIYNSGNWQGVEFCNFDTRSHLPVIAEIFKMDANSSFPPPEAIFPPS